MFQMKLYVSEGMWEFNGFISWLSFKLGMDVVLYSEIITVLFKCLIFPPVRLQTLNRRHELTWAADLCSERFLLMFWCKQLLYSGWSFIFIKTQKWRIYFRVSFSSTPFISHGDCECALCPWYNNALQCVHLTLCLISHVRTRRSRGSNPTLRLRHGPNKPAVITVTVLAPKTGSEPCRLTRFSWRLRSRTSPPRPCSWKKCLWSLPWCTTSPNWTPCAQERSGKLLTAYTTHDTYHTHSVSYRAYTVFRV